MASSSSNKKIGGGCEILRFHYGQLGFVFAQIQQKDVELPAAQAALQLKDRDIATLKAEAGEKDAEIERLNEGLLQMRQKFEKALKAQQDLLRGFQARFQ